jgi:hypothetical protein
MESVIVNLDHGFARTYGLPQPIGYRKFFICYILEYLIVSFDELLFPKVRPGLLYLFKSIGRLTIFGFDVYIHFEAILYQFKQHSKFNNKGRFY